MNTIDIINKLSVAHGLSLGRTEMILSIIFEKITERLKKEGSISIEGFGVFSIENKVRKDSFGEALSRKYITFTPDKYFLEKINT